MKRGLVMKTFLCLVLAGVGCKDDATGTEPFDTYQLCFDKLTEQDMRPVLESIVECCIDHPIGGVAPVCGGTQPDCINYLTANLLQTDASTVEVMEGCQLYIDELATRP